jgi:hypothetical protein
MGFESRKIAFLLVYTLKTNTEGFMRSKNYLSYIGAELNNYKGGKVFWGTDEDQLIKDAYSDNYDYGFIIREGTVFLSWSGFLEAIEKIWTPEHFCLGHILDRKERYFEIHNQCIFLDLNKIEKMGFPSFKKDLDSPQCLRRIERSTENFHDDYTPLWISVAEGNMSVQKLNRGSRWLSLALDSGYRVGPFPKEARDHKEFYYPEHEESYESNKIYIQDRAAIDTQSFFLYNTEDFAKNDDIKPLNRLIMPASGLMPLYILKHYGYAADPDINRGQTEIYIYDIGHIHLETYRKIIFDWDGEKYRQYLEWLLGPCLLKGKQWEKFDRVLFEKYFGCNQGFRDWLGKVKQHCEFIFIQGNALAKKFKREPWLELPEDQVGYLSLSNVFHYWPTSIEYSYRYRLETLNELMTHLSQKSPHLWVNFCRPEKGESGVVAPRSSLIQARDYQPETPVLMPWEDR